MLRTLQARLFLSYLLITGLMLALMVVGLIVLLRNNPLTDQILYRRLEFGLPLISRRQGRSLLELGPREIEQAMERLEQVLGERTILLGPDGQVIADSQPGSSGLNPQTIRQALEQTPSNRGRFADEHSNQWLFVSQRLDDGYALVVLAQRPVVRVLAGLFGDDLLRPLTQAGVVALVLSIILSWYIARSIARPLDRMARAARAVANGDFNQELSIRGAREVESLATAFTEMVHQVESSQESQRDFVANVSHELKTPLTSIQGFAQAILDGTVKDDSEKMHAARVIFDESDRLRRLVEELLDLARLDAGQIVFRRDRIDLAAIVANVIERLQIRAQETGVAILNQLPEIPSMVGDGDRLSQVFTNLLDNAIKHSPQGGEVWLLGEASQGWVTIHVVDQGSGIPNDQLSRIFERFYQMDKARTSRGVGLGLPISREIVRKHDGDLTVISEAGRGSRFSIRLPLMRSDDSTFQHQQS